MGDYHFQPTETWSFTKKDEPIYHLMFSPDGNDIVVSQWNGDVKIISAISGRTSYEYHFEDANTLVSASLFNPGNPSLILSVSPSGKIGLMDYEEKVPLWKLKEKNEIYAAAFDKSGEFFVTAGKDKTIRLYNCEENKLLLEMAWSDPLTQHFHAARVYSVIFDKERNDMVYSGGWDNRVIQWDTRCGQSALTISGPFICGDSLDTKGHYMLTGSWRPNWPLEIWDVRNGKRVSSREWGADSKCKIYCSKFFKNNNYIVAGGSECNCIKTFNTTDWSEGQRLGMFTEAVTSIALSPNGSSIAVSSQGGKCCCFSKQY